MKDKVSLKLGQTDSPNAAKWVKAASKNVTPANEKMIVVKEGWLNKKGGSRYSHIFLVLIIMDIVLQGATGKSVGLCFK